MTPLDRVTDALRAHGCDPRPNGAGWSARCPEHDDRHASLSYTEGDDGRVLIKCHVGCAFDDIITAVDLTVGDLFPNDDKPSPARRILEAYDYTDEQGRLLFQAVRYSPKDFRQRRPDGNGGWEWKLGDTPRVLYRLPRVLEAIRDGLDIIVVEGEKDVEAIERAEPGVAATTNPMGAGKWRPEHAETLRGAGRVLVVSDRDDTGRQHAAAVMSSLDGLVGELMLAESAAGNDVTDHLNAGHTLEELVQVVEEEHDEPGDDREIAADGYRLTDTGNASRLIALCPDCFKFAHAWGRWLVYDGTRWAIDEEDALITEQAKGVARGLLQLATADGIDSKERERILKWAIRSESAGSIAAMIKLARGIPDVIVEHEDLDANPNILNVANGTVDLCTGELQHHNPADLCTKIVPVDYDPDARSELWERCLERWQPDLDMHDYLQVEAGAAATGRHTETLSVHYGTGGNGKSKFWGGVQHVLGDYTVTPHKSLLVTQRNEQHETVKADLFRARLALAAETKAADVLDDEQVKSITGGDRQRARRMREDPWFFWPSHVLVLFSNHRPRIQGRDESVWRRVRLIPWPVTIPEAERDTELADKLWQERAGILAWIVEGARRFLTHGFDPPDTVRAATADYRRDEDHVGRFVTECLTISDGSRAKTIDIAEEAEHWATDQGIDALAMNEIATALKTAGCTNRRQTIAGKKYTVWHGVGITTDTTDTPSDQP